MPIPRPVRVLLLLIISLVIGGCWDAADVKDLYIPFTAGYDYIEKQGEGKLVASVNYPVFARMAKEHSDILVMEGDTVGETRIDKGNKLARRLAIGDLNTLLIGRDLAVRGTREVFDYMFRNPQFSELMKLAVVDGLARDVLQIKPVHYQTVGQNIIELLKNADRSNFIPDMALHDFRICVITPGFNPVLPVLRIHGQNKIEVAGAAIFKGYRMVAMVNKDEMRAVTWLRGEKSTGDITFELVDQAGNQKKLTFEGTNSRSVKAKLVDGVPYFEIEVKLAGEIIESLVGFQFAGKEENIKLAEAALARYIEGKCRSMLEDLQCKYRVDAILLGKYARAKWPDLVRQDWDEHFCNSIIKVKVKVIIRGSGEVA
ncbi:Ger(x)C family spore germination protein [Desulforamulus hydrothermalis]|uniref:Spore germination B3 GerAC family protein n=1 Tax=Desulforamulus hydrothermalis Lam5 = DSM 18033 TaxID=1121428 RepID=K8DXJ2_9FIRM|nr:Ger(x)C family spore germination protein [Desulforamulus hydrothermalis]CCO07309.1 Spore germination B3 GerAC family protein [Desulforamulus hydrothermalis Lam5 = DSM 18033]SHG93739.1 germination protein, Ger(x)C family [Desulforamulus hydrothermalis Lam5 = DSM 18033]